MVFSTRLEILDANTHRYCILRGGEPISFAAALLLWQNDHSFREHFIASLRDSPFIAFRWETPAVSIQLKDRTFEFVLLNAPHLHKKADHQTFADYFTDDETRFGIVAFANLGNDATLIVPSPRTCHTAYPHFAIFMREGPDEQKHALLQELGRIALDQVTQRPLWISTAGGGVAWLHVRIAHSPKYYGYSPYKSRL